MYHTLTTDVDFNLFTYFYIYMHTLSVPVTIIMLYLLSNLFVFNPLYFKLFLDVCSLYTYIYLLVIIDRFQ